MKHLSEIKKIKKELFKESKTLESLSIYRVYLMKALETLQKSGNDDDRYLPDNIANNILFVKEELNKSNIESINIKRRLMKEGKFKIRNIHSTQSRIEIMNGENLEVIIE